jgi:predicted house-cleaning noncanonical NTP pyrophosphatase (MazG superfamily)
VALDDVSSNARMAHEDVYNSDDDEALALALQEEFRRELQAEQQLHQHNVADIGSSVASASATQPPLNNSARDVSTNLSFRGTSARQYISSRGSNNNSVLLDHAVTGTETDEEFARRLEQTFREEEQQFSSSNGRNLTPYVTNSSRVRNTTTDAIEVSDAEYTRRLALSLQSEEGSPYLDDSQDDELAARQVQHNIHVQEAAKSSTGSKKKLDLADTPHTSLTSSDR